MNIDLPLLLLGVVLIAVGLFLKEFFRLMTRNADKIRNPEKYATPDDIVHGTRLEIDEEGYTKIIPTKRYKDDFYL